MRKLYLHVGFAKCGSTSLQEALLACQGGKILYPRSGINGAEHLAVALHLRGVDNWTRRYFDETWTEQQHHALMGEIAASDRNVVLSSERLADLSTPEIKKAVEEFKSFDIEVIFIKRAAEKYLNSTWRHAVFYHDYAEKYETFLEIKKHFSFDRAIDKFRGHLPVHVFDMDDADCYFKIGELLGAQFEVPVLNVGVPFEFAKLLQETHALLGSKKFKEIFGMETKLQMLAVRAGEQAVDIAPLDVVLF